MASKSHDFIISAIARKIRLYGFKIIYLDGKFQEINTKKYDIPPKIVNHRPDIIGEKDKSFCIGEAKTQSDISSKRSKNQIVDFAKIVESNSDNRLILGIPINAKEHLNRLLSALGLLNHKQIEIILVPEELLPYEEDI